MGGHQRPWIVRVSGMIVVQGSAALRTIKVARAEWDRRLE
jgi:hypothetical protein